MTTYSSTQVAQILPLAAARPVVYVEVETRRDGKLIGTAWHVLRRVAGSYRHASHEALGEAVTADDFAIGEMESLARLVMRPLKFEWPEGGCDIVDPTDGAKLRTWSVDSAMRAALRLDEGGLTHVGLRHADTAAAAGRHAEAREWLAGLVATLRARCGRGERDEKVLHEALRRWR